MKILAAPRSSLPLARGTALAAFIFISLPRARAEGAITYKYEDYREAGGRIGVKTQGAIIEQSLGSDTRLKVEGMIDAIAGATPDGQKAPAGSDQVPLSQLTDRRKAWNAEFSRQFPRVNLALGFANSRESDYVSNGVSLNTLTDFNQKNTTLLVGLAATDDDVTARYLKTIEKKRSEDFIIGLTQLLDPQTSVTLNFTWGRARGFLNDPYKLVEKNVEIFPGLFLVRTYPENRPDQRDKWIVYTSVNHAFPALHGAVEASYRFYHDTYATSAHTVDLSWFQKLGDRFVLKPGFRFYDQSAADFYHYDLDRTNLLPTFGRPHPEGPFYSSDYRLSAFRSYTTGLKLVWRASDWLQLDAALERYEMRGQDGATPQSAYLHAKVVTLGARLSW